MKLQITSHIKGVDRVSCKYLFIKGFLSVEIMIALSLFTLFSISTFTLSTTMQDMKLWSLKRLDLIKESVEVMDGALRDDSPSTTASLYGNDSVFLNSQLFSAVKSNYINGWGSSNCSPRIDFDKTKVEYFDSGVFLGAGNASTDIEARNSIAYVTADSASQSLSDIFIIDAKDFNNSTIISSLNTGPGLSSIAVAGPYLYVANTGTLSQLQIIDIHDRVSPRIVSQLKLSLPEASTTPPRASSVFYRNGYVYLGTNKWDGPEFYSIDVTDPLLPKIVGSFETNTLVNDIYVYDDRAYLATSDEKQMRVIDTKDKSNLILVNSFTSSGWQTQQGKVIEYFENTMGFGRTVGGINQISNHEAFMFSTSNATSSVMPVEYSKDIPGGVYGFLIRNPYIYLLTHALGEEFQVWNTDFTSKIYSKSLGNMSVAMSCDWSNIFFATGDEKAIAVLKLK